MSNITNITKIDGGWQYTLDTAPANGWDIWLAAVRLETRYTSTTYKLYQSDPYPPPIEVIDPYNDTPSYGSAGKIRLQWQHVGATYYIVERSTDNITFNRVGIVPGSGNVWHTFVFPGADGTTYWKVYPAAEDATGYYKTGYALPFTVEQSVLPTPPDVRVAYSAGNLTITRLVALREEMVVVGESLLPVTYGGTLDEQSESL